MGKERREEMMQYYQRGRYGVDYIGRPIYIERTGTIDPLKLFKVIDEDTFWSDFCQAYEKLVKLQFLVTSLVHQKQINHSFSITDMRGFSMKQMSSQVYAMIKKAS